MTPADVQNTLKALALTQKQLITATSAVSTTAGFEPGQKFQANVLAQLAPGVFKVQVAEHMLQLQLPATIRSGDTISLQVVSLLPRLTFNMAASANPLSTADQLSASARLLSSLTQQPLENAFVRSFSSKPLWTGTSPFPETSELAGSLHSALSQSGLFYEAHQAQWIAGTRHKNQLMSEPQNMTAIKMNTAQVLDDTAKPLNLSNTHQRESFSSIPEHVLSLVQQQLHALETRQVQWQGQVWENQQMDWKIREEPSHTADEDEGRQWVTQIFLDLPNLGEVSATFRFRNGDVTLALTATESATRDKLGAASSQLVSAMTDRGISISSALVQQHDND